MKKSKGLPDLHMDDNNDEPHDYEVDDAVRTLEQGEAIKKNKKLMPHVHKKISSKINSLKDLKKMANQKKMEEDAPAADDNAPPEPV